MDYFAEWLRRLHELRLNDGFIKAQSCKHCTNLYDSFGHYNGTYCHINQKHLVNLQDDCLGDCTHCKLYERKEENGKTARKKALNDRRKGVLAP